MFFLRISFAFLHRKGQFHCSWLQYATTSSTWPPYWYAICILLWFSQSSEQGNKLSSNHFTSINSITLSDSSWLPGDPAAVHFCGMCCRDLGRLWHTLGRSSLELRADEPPGGGNVASEMRNCWKSTLLWGPLSKMLHEMLLHGTCLSSSLLPRQPIHTADPDLCFSGLYCCRSDVESKLFWHKHCSSASS